MKYTKSVSVTGMFWGGLIGVVAALLVVYPAVAVDLFAAAKTEIKENTDTNSALYQAMIVTGLGSAALSGFLTKNWGGAIGGFVVGMIFVHTTMSIVNS